MGRRNRRTSTNHAIRVKREDSVSTSYLWGKSWCGEEHAMSASLSNAAEGEDLLAYSRRSTDCPKCAAAIGKARMAQIGDRVKLEAADPELIMGKYGRKFRGLYRVSIDGTHRAWVVMQNGWGNPWELHQLTDREDGYSPFGSTLSDMPGKYSKVDPDRDFQMVHFYSKEMMASAALRIFNKDPRNLPTIPEMQAAAERERERRRQEAADREERMRLAGIERERKDKLREERKATAINGLTEIEQRADLTNLEKAGLAAALDIIMGRDVA